jgi:hypothetical protein
MSITDQITNLSREDGELELLYHINFGTPLLNPGSKVVLPVATMAPRDEVAVGNLAEWDTYGPATAGLSEAVFFFDLAADADGRTQAVLHNAAGDQGVSLRFSKEQLPCFTLWKNRQMEADGYVTGLEPGINYPNTKSVEKAHSRVAILAPGQSRTFQIDLDVLPDARAVSTAKAAVAALQQGTAPEVMPRPNPAWSAD